MIDVRKLETLGGADHGWLDAKHHFSFANYYDPDRMGWGPLRVWNDDRIEAGTGFPPHPHRDMEIITYVRKGAITHRDHMNNEGRTVAGDVQVMSAGKGVEHAEWNLEPEDTTLFQIWIEPREKGIRPRWEAATFPKEDRKNQLVQLASGKADAPVVFGWILAAHQVGASAIALLAGVLRADLGSYVAPFMISGALCLAAAVLVLWIGTAQRGAGGLEGATS